MGTGSGEAGESVVRLVKADIFMVARFKIFVFEHSEFKDCSSGEPGNLGIKIFVILIELSFFSTGFSRFMFRLKFNSKEGGSSSKWFWASFLISPADFITGFDDWSFSFASADCKIEFYDWPPISGTASLDCKIESNGWFCASAGCTVKFYVAYALSVSALGRIKVDGWFFVFWISTVSADCDI